MQFINNEPAFIHVRMGRYIYAITVVFQEEQHFHLSHGIRGLHAEF